MGISRAQAASSAIGSTRAEGREPSERVRHVLELWGSGGIDDAQLARIQARIEAQEPIEDLLPTAV